MSAQHDLLGWRLEHVRTTESGERIATRGRCVGAWGSGGILTLALLTEEERIVTVVSHVWDELRLAGGRKVVAA